MHTCTSTLKAKLAEAKAVEAAAQQQAASSSAPPPIIASSVLSSSAAAPPFETFAWLSGTTSAVKSDAGLALQTGSATITHAPAALDEHRPYAKLLKANNAQRIPAAATQSYATEAESSIRVKGAAAERGLSTLWPSQLPPTAAPAGVTSLQAAYNPPSRTQLDVSSSDMPLLQSSSSLGASSLGSTLDAQDWQAILEPLIPLDIPAAVQPGQPLSAEAWSDGTASSSTTSSVGAALVTGAGGGSRSSSETSGAGQGRSSESSPEAIETIETIGSSRTSEAKLKEKEKQYKLALYAAKFWRQANPLPIAAADDLREQPAGVFASEDESGSPGAPDDGLASIMTHEEFQNSSIYRNMLSRVLQLQAMTPQQFDDWLKPTVVRKGHLSMLHTDPIRAMYRNSVSGI